MDALTIITLVISAASAVYAHSMVNTPEQSDTGQTVNKAGTTASRNPVYGTTRTGAVPVYTNVNNDANQYLTQVFTFGIGVTGVRQLYIDDAEVLSTDAISHREDPNSADGTSQLTFSGSELQNGFENQCVVQLRAGLETGIPMQLAIDNSDGEWTLDHRGDLCCAATVRSLRIVDSEAVRILSDAYNIQALVDGLPVFDPRYSVDPSVKQFEHDDTVPSLYRECGRNPVLQCLDYITSTYYGMGVGFEYIDLESFREAANYCDDFGEGGAQGIKSDGVVDNSASFADALLSFMSSGNFYLTVENGLIYARFNAIEIASFHFDESNILNNAFSVQEANSDNYFNVVEVNFKNSELNDAQDTFTIPEDIYTDPQIQSDGFVQAMTIDMPFARVAGSTVNDSFVQRIANEAMARNQYLKGVTFDMDLHKYPVKIGDVIEVSNEALQWVRREFRVREISKSANAPEGVNIATLACNEYNDNIYIEDNNGNGGGDQTPPPVVVTPPDSLAFDQEDYITDGYGTLSWNPTYFGSNTTYIVDYRLANAPAWTRLGEVSGRTFKVGRLRQGQYEFRVATKSALYGLSDFVELLVDIDGIVLPTVTGLAADFTGTSLILNWDSMLDEPIDTNSGDNPDSAPRVVRDVFSHYLISYFDSGGNPVKSFTTGSNSHIYTFEDSVENGIRRTLESRVFIVATDGTQSTPASVDATNNQCAAVANPVIETSLQTTSIRWDVPTETDYLYTKIHASTTADFDPNTGNLIDTVRGGLFTKVWPDETIRYLKVGHVDVFGDDGVLYTNDLEANPQNINDLLPNIGDQLEDIRDPSNAATDTGEFVANVVSPNQKKTAGYGMFAADDGTSDFIVAADRFMVAAGAEAEWVSGTSYAAGERATYTTQSGNELIMALYEADVATSGTTPPPSSGDWTLINSNLNQAVFYVDAATSKVIIENAVIDDLNGNQILAGSITTAELAADAITGDKIDAQTSIEVGTGNQVARLDGTGSVRISAGNANPSSAPFQVDQAGKMTATNAEVTGTINATSGEFNGEVKVPSSASESSGVYIRSDGQLFAQGGTFRGTIYASSGEFSGDITGASGEFNGTVQAENIVGDVVGAITKLHPSRDDSSGAVPSGTWVDVVSVSFSESRPYARTLSMRNVDFGSFSALLGGSSNTNSTAYWRLYNSTTGEVYYDRSFLLQFWSGDQPPYTHETSVVEPTGTIPADTPPSTIILQVSHSFNLSFVSFAYDYGGDEVPIEQYYITQLFQDSGELS